MTVPACPIPEDDSSAIDTATEIYGDHDDTDLDGMGNAFECCQASDNGHLFLTSCGETICVHCERVAWR